MNMYVLDKNNMPKKVNDTTTWVKQFEKKNRQVNRTRLEVSVSQLFGKDKKAGFIDISTVFLGLDHQFGDGPPLLFETMVFGGEHDEYQERCSTWEAAEQMHNKIVQMVKR